MKVKELISILEKLDPELTVLVDGYEDGFDNIRSLQKIKVEPDNDKKEKYWLGDYKISLADNAESAILIPRS